MRRNPHHTKRGPGRRHVQGKLQRQAGIRTAPKWLAMDVETWAKAQAHPGPLVIEESTPLRRPTGPLRPESRTDPPAATPTNWGPDTADPFAEWSRLADGWSHLASRR